jgi:hypothetical protein
MKFKNLPEELPVETRVASALSQTQILDIHTHLYDPAMGKMLLWGIDELLTYHYLVAESFRFFKMPYKDFFLLEKKQQAELIWNELFIKHSPISESCRGVITTLNMLGLDVNRRDLNSIRKWFAQRTVEQHVEEVFESANLSAAVMTNSPFDSEESAFWKKGFSRDSRFLSALRVDPLVLEYNSVVGFLRQQGFDVRSDLDQKTRDELMRFLHLWADTIQPLYLMASLPPGYSSALDSEDSSILTQVILPFCKTRGLPFAIMAGVTRSVNPLLGLAGDSLGSFSIESIEKLCRTFPDNKFLVTALSRENQHHLCVASRKFSNLHPFGCWWFTNIPTLIDEISNLRFELLGLSFTPQHSDARVMDQLLYKWTHFKESLILTLGEKYSALEASGWDVGDEEIKRDLKGLLGGEFLKFSGISSV